MLDKALLISVILAAFIIQCESKYGEKCELYTSNCDIVENCRNGRCECRTASSLQYNTRAVPSCVLPTFGLNCSDENNCKDDQTCGSPSQCICKNSSQVIVSGGCVTVHYQDVTDKCYVKDNTAFLCSHDNNSFCLSGRCGCFKEYFYNQTSKSCEPKKNYTTYHNITEYKARPEEYCLGTHDCIDGLRCLSKFVCDCPRPCKYKRSEQTCDCGKVEFEFPTAAVVVGVLLGMLSFALWISLIRRTIKKEGKRKQVMILSVRNNDQDMSMIDETNNKCDPIVADAPPPYSIYPETNNEPVPPLGFDMNNDPYLSKKDNAPPAYAN